jgi:beta-glucosidase
MPGFPSTPLTVRLAGLLMLVAASAVLSARQPAPLYKDPSRPVPERVADLLGRMTLEEKVAQLVTRWTTLKPLQDADGNFVPAGAPALLGQGLGQLARPSEIGGTAAGPHVRGARRHAEFTNAVQKWLIENTRLGIPVLFHEEALHGFVAPQATHFPVPLGLGATWNPALVERAMAVAAREARARGCQTVLAPVIDLARDPRWGRIEETFGEDPFHVSELGLAAIRGYQGRTLPLQPGKVIATLKHFAGHGSHEGGVNTAPTLAGGERHYRAELLWPFERAVKEGGAYCVMPSYNEIDGVPAHVNRWLLDDLLRGEWGFRGLVVSDYNAISQLASRHKVAADGPAAAIQAIEAGNDFELPDPETYLTLVDAVKAGTVSTATIDRSVARVLEMKFLAGLFEHPYVNADDAEAIVKTPEHRALSLDAARQAIVLLQNRNNALPLDRAKIRTLAVIGPNAKGVHVGGYSSVQPPPSVDVLSGITAKAGPGVKVVHAEGVRITESEPNWWNDKVELADPVKNRQRIQQALPVAKSADAIVLVLGTNESVSREAWADSHLGDAADVTVPGQQQELVDAIVALGKPTVAVLIHGRPLAIPQLADKVPAILDAWYVGQEGGTAVGEILFGDVNPGGKLPVTLPRSVGQLPVYYNRKPTSFRGYIDSTREPLFVFGHGLSYTTFALSGAKVVPATIKPNGEATVSVEVANTGARAGDEVVQLYVRDVVSSVTRPVKELRGFQRVSLEPGAKKTVTFTVGPLHLSLIDAHMKRVVEPGRFELLVGTSSGQPASTLTLDVERP